VFRKKNEVSWQTAKLIVVKGLEDRDIDIPKRVWGSPDSRHDDLKNETCKKKKRGGGGGGGSGGFLSLRNHTKCSAA